MIGLALTNTGILRSTDDGESWSSVYSYANMRGAAHIGGGVVFAVSSDRHFHKSIDSGASWTDLGAYGSAVVGFDDIKFLGNHTLIVSCPGAGCISFGRIIRSINDGVSWTTPFSDSYPVGRFTNLGSGVALCSAPASVLKSSDYGATWTSHYFIYTTGDTLTSKIWDVGSGIVLASGFAMKDPGCYVKFQTYIDQSTDNGDSFPLVYSKYWEHTAAPPPNDWIGDPLPIAPFTDFVSFGSTVYVFAQGSGATYRSLDSGATWSFFSGSYYVPSYAFKLDTATAVGFLSGDIVKTTNSGATWSTKYSIAGVNNFEFFSGGGHTEITYLVTAPSRNGNHVRSQVNFPVLMTHLTGDSTYFGTEAKIRRVDVHYYDPNMRERKEVVHMGGYPDMHSFVAWTPNASDGTWTKQKIIVYDTEDAVHEIERAEIGSSEDVALT